MAIDVSYCNKVAEDLIERAKIRRNATNRKSVQAGKTDRIADQLERAARVIYALLAERIDE